MDKIDIRIFKDKLSRHEEGWLTLLREAGGFQFQSMPVAPGFSGSTADARTRADWLAHPQEMPAMTALQGVYHRKLFRDFNDVLIEKAEQSAYSFKKETKMGITPTMASEFDLCVKEYLSSVSKYFENEKNIHSDVETCRDANAAILLTFAIGSDNQNSTRAIIKAIPGALDVYLCKDMIQPSRLDNEWIRPAAAIIHMNCPEMVDCLINSGWKATDRVAVILNKPPTEGDFKEAERLGPTQGGALFNLLINNVRIEVPTSPSMVESISVVSKEIWSTEGSHWDRSLMDMFEGFANTTLKPGYKGSHSEVVLQHFLKNGVMDWDIDNFALTAFQANNLKFINKAANRLKWEDLTFETNNFLPSLMAQKIFDSQLFEPGLMHQTVDNLCKACIASGHGDMLKGASVIEKHSTPHRPLNDFIKANCVDSVIMALDSGANPQEVSVLGHNAFWYAKNSGHEGMVEIISAHVKKKTAMAILDELFESHPGIKP